MVWDVFKACIRGICIKIGGWNKKKQNEEISDLNLEIARLQSLHKVKGEIIKHQMDQVTAKPQLLEVRQWRNRLT